MGRAATGVRGIRLRDGDFCVGAVRADEDGLLLSVTENGYGKKTPITEYLRGGEDAGPQKRGGMGLKNYNVTDKTGPVTGIKLVTDSHDLLLISDDGTIIRMDTASISTLGRATQGVHLMRVSDGAKVISIALADKEDEDEDSDLPGDVPETPAE